MDNPSPLTILSLCTGYGGLELGLSRALENPLRVVAVEIEAYALALLESKASQKLLAIEAMYPDLKTFPAERFSGCFDIILAGYPCQPFSCAGKRKGTEDPRHLWPHIARIVKAVRPVYCFFENVPGHLTLGFPEVYCSLRDMGYSVEAGLFTASEVGAPHKRQRLFILAHRAGEHDRLRCRDGYSTDEAIESRGPANRGNPTFESSGNGARKLADAGKQGSQEPGPGGLEQAYPSIISRWPARPGQPQYEWEQPRVVVDNPMQRRHRAQEGEIRTGWNCTEHPGELEDPTRLLRSGLGWQVRRRRGVCETSKGQAQPILGMPTHGIGQALDPAPNRVDQLRLCGNGVVWQQAAKAFRELI